MGPIRDLRFWILLYVEQLAQADQRYNTWHPCVELSLLFNELTAPNADILEAIAQLKEDGSVMDYDDRSVTFKRRLT